MLIKISRNASLMGYIQLYTCTWVEAALAEVRIIQLHTLGGLQVLGSEDLKTYEPSPHSGELVPYPTVLCVCRGASVRDKIGCLPDSTVPGNFFCYVVDPLGCPLAVPSTVFRGAGFRPCRPAIEANTTNFRSVLDILAEVRFPQKNSGILPFKSLTRLR